MDDNDPDPDAMPTVIAARGELRIP